MQMVWKVSCMFSFIFIMNYVKHTRLLRLTVPSVQSFHEKNSFSVHNKDLQILHPPMKKRDLLQFRARPEAPMRSHPSPWDIWVLLFQMMNLARIHDKRTLKKFWEQKIEKHVERTGSEDSRMKTSALSKYDVCQSRSSSGEIAAVGRAEE